MSVSQDERLMARALDEARRGRPSPNPHVGAVVASPAGEVLAVGHHARAGDAHAEVAAIQAAPRTEGQVLYVTMTPCNHHGRTPPCTDAVIAAGFAKVVVGATDPAPHVPGAVEKLRAAGIEVVTEVLSGECRALIADFEKHITTGLPHVTLKAAVTLDGRMAARTGDSKWITGLEARTEAHRMRDRADAVLVGVGTVLADDPQLNVRHVEGRDPIRVVLDAGLRTPADAKILGQGGATWILHGPGAPAERRAALAEAGAELLELPAVEGAVALDAALKALGEREVVRLLVEGGPTVHHALLSGGFADRVAVFVAPRILGDSRAPSFASADVPRATMAEAWGLERVRSRPLGVDILIEGELPAREER
ncbi:MAG TPA: bifunctional diaminohydroxyphosphoribosylaminopyrimidine deaminase/5-amino-6-(5-phosphoribosylamino)uracil reductase RibD [Polyangiaceae bacterium LLY-WYZ-15_(1-7)]|nr:riboflavin biosynthesis protein RibD [Myxococcales bacterium]MAT23557.1 riboflavin biosynthesis protein RibD [Sandaracinus sp.]HJL05283.1 bifunctional diaminohydroxyphosphoribosylaminopyrimidine deaminase/5-amino-6-(5-phosphoribosylamino)uracil reductase RibD [Polyangiaceae bacterium LLY-WYZ-15_(1-7)]HJL07901.1 bifunctional diaminohydroxyphosphoribosylaminopyrimidine deaminase/5-amino-6-(5-phosphoribosylamino)uracil reductase RibD [Polyangiaceae bacterium LLY-WYZ-15_(1-7)]HJL23442.1 bifuncti